MADVPVPDVEISTFFIETMVPVTTVAAATAPGQQMSAVDTLSLYLLDLMELQGYRVVSGVRVEIPEPDGPVEYPTGWTVLRLHVDVQEFDIGV